MILYQCRVYRCRKFVLRITLAKIQQQPVCLFVIPRSNKAVGGVELRIHANTGLWRYLDNAAKTLRRQHMLTLRCSGLSLFINTGRNALHCIAIPTALRRQQRQSLLVIKLGLLKAPQLEFAVAS